MKKRLKDILRKIRNQVVKVFNLFPISNIILFESNPDFNDEGYWMCKKFLDEGMDQKHEIYWYLKSRDSAIPDGWNVKCIYVHPLSFRELFKKYYVLHTARCILDSCQFIPKSRRGQFRMFLQHGMPMKRIDTYMGAIGEYDYFSIGSSFLSDYYSSVGIPVGKQVMLGMSRNDQLGIRNNVTNYLFPEYAGCKKIIWMPTYRQHESSSDNGCNIPADNENTQYGIPVLYTPDDAERVNNKLNSEHMVLIIKPHPSQDARYLHLEEMTNIKILTSQMLAESGIQLYSILSDMDALITDYSSVYYDFLLTHRPIGLTIDDLDIYENEVGFILEKYKDHVIGFSISHVDDFLEFLEMVSKEDNSLEESLDRACDKYNDVQDFTSSDRLFQFIVEKASL